MKAEDQFHAGIVVDDIEATMTELSAVFDYQWGDIIAAATLVTLPSGPTTLDMRLAYSRSVPRLEVIQTMPGTLWEPAAGSGVHHLGYWSDDVAGDAATLEEHGFTREAAGTDADGHAYWTYHRATTGPRIELISRTLAAALEPFWAPLP